jgi:YD repeat-containing protein
MKCRGCGVELDPNQQQVNSAPDPALRHALKDVQQNGGACPLCGRSRYVPYWRRRKVLLGVLKAALLIGTVVEVAFYLARTTDRAAVTREALARMNASPVLVQFLGKPIKSHSNITGNVKQDETGWKEAKLTIPVHGPSGDGTAHVVGGKGTGPWLFSTFEVILEKQKKKMDLISGRVVDYDPAGYIEVHTQAAAQPEYRDGQAATPPRWDGTFPCVFASVDQSEATPHLGKCAILPDKSAAVDRLETDLRYGHFRLQQTDLHLDGLFAVPLTRCYVSRDWLHNNPVHAFGRNSNHTFDMSPVGTRNPYTYQLILLGNGDFLYFDRISEGAGYADAVYQHTETSTRFYRATQRWNGDGWTTKLADGSEIRFPESYNATNTAQGAAIEMRDAQGNRLEMRRDSQRNLQEIKTPHGRWIRFQYDDFARIVHAEDDAGNWAAYSYNPNGMLTDVIISSGRKRHYQYDGVLMTQISDEHGRVLLRNSYESEVLVRQEFGNGTSYSYDYQWARKGTYVESVVISSANGTKKTVWVADSIPEHVKNSN